MTPMWQFYDGKRRSWQYSEVATEFPEGTLVQEGLSIRGQPPSLQQVRWRDGRVPVWWGPIAQGEGTLHGKVQLNWNKFEHVWGCPSMMRSKWISLNMTEWTSLNKAHVWSPDEEISPFPPPPSPQTDRHDWKYYLPTSLAGGKNAEWREWPFVSKNVRIPPVLKGLSKLHNHKLSCIMVCWSRSCCFWDV